VPVKRVATRAPAATTPPMSGRVMRLVDVDMFVAFRGWTFDHAHRLCRA
jgi:hypothetical protein